MLYVVGDSFTWGDELADHIVPNFWGWLDQMTPEQEARQAGQRPYPPHMMDQLDAYRIENRWSNILGKHLNMEVVNKGMPGKSIHGMLTAISHDIDALRKAKLVIIQLTGLHRFQVPFLSGDDFYIQDGYAQLNPLLGLEFEKPEYREIGKLRMIGTEEIDFLYDYLSTVLLIRQLVNYVTNTDVLIVDSLFLKQAGNIKDQIEEYKEQPNIKKMLELTDFENKANLFPTMADIYNQNRDLCHTSIGGHYCHTTHKLFADALYDVIIRENLFPKKD